MARERPSKRVFGPVAPLSLQILNALIPPRGGETRTERADKLAIAVLQKFFGVAWRDKHIVHSRSGYIRASALDPVAQETVRMRRILLAEMLYNLQPIRGFQSVCRKMSDGDIESAYAELEVGRLITALAIDPGVQFEFVETSGVKRKDYDLNILFSDGILVCAETKCKVEGTAISLRTIEDTLSKAKEQLPLDAPGIIFIKIPKRWTADPAFEDQIKMKFHEFLVRSPSIVSIKHYIADIEYEENPDFFRIGEFIGVYERHNLKHQFAGLRYRDWRMFPTQDKIQRPMAEVYNGMPPHWQRLLF